MQNIARNIHFLDKKAIFVLQVFFYESKSFFDRCTLDLVRNVCSKINAYGVCPIRLLQSFDLTIRICQASKSFNSDIARVLVFWLTHEDNDSVVKFQIHVTQ